MKNKKLSLDKVNVARLNATHTILGGRKPYKDDGDTAGIGVPVSTHCPDPPRNPFSNISDVPWVSANTKRPAPNSRATLSD